MSEHYETAELAKEESDELTYKHEIIIDTQSIDEQIKNLKKKIGIAILLCRIILYCLVFYLGFVFKTLFDLL